MLSTATFIQAMIPLYIMAIIGFISRKIKILNCHANHILTQLMLYITLPALILFSLNIDFSQDVFADFTWLIFMSLFVLSLSVYLARQLRKRAILPVRQRSVYESLIIFGNQGFIGFAISYILMGNKGIVYLTFFNIFYLILIWTYGIYIFNKKHLTSDWQRLILNPGIVSTLLGLFIMFTPLYWPVALLETFESVGKMTIPLSMILIGSLLADISWSNFQTYTQNIYIWIAALFKLVLIPLTLFIFILFHVPYPLIVIAVLTAGMPSASTTTVYAQKFGDDSAFASFGVIASTLLCTLTIPLLYLLITWLYPYFY